MPCCVFLERLLRRSALVFFCLLIALAGCGVGFDALHMLIGQPSLEVLFAVLEDGGEMVAITGFTFYSLHLLANTSPRRMEMIADLMASRGHGDRVVEKVLGGNFARLFGEVWK